jgi:preprotein translocase subunit SecG
MHYFSKSQPNLVDSYSKQTTIFSKPPTVINNSYSSNLSGGVKIPSNLQTFISNNILGICVIVFFICILTYRYYDTKQKKENNKLMNSQLIKYHQQQLANQEYIYRLNQEKLHNMNEYSSQQFAPPPRQQIKRAIPVRNDPLDKFFAPLS